MKNRVKILVFIILGSVLNDTYSQGNIVNIGSSGSPLNTIRTGAPVLSINTNPQAMGMGYIGVVASELNTQNGLDQNPALLSSEEDVFGAQILNYSPHARNSPIASRLFESGIYASLGKHSFSFSSRYLSLSEIFTTDIVGNVTNTFTPFEFFVSGSYAYKLSKNLSIGGSLKYLHSDFTDGTIIQGIPTMPANVIAGDLGLSYRKTLKETESFKFKWNLGISVLNIGNKVRYVESADGLFLPQTLKLGSLFTLQWKKENKNYFAIDFAYQADKLLVPTPPIYAFNPTNGFVIVEGLDPNVNPFRGIVQSFYDAPEGFNEELREIIHHFGTEARLSFADNKILAALRAGYFNEHNTKGARKFFTAGAGIGLLGMRVDFAKVFPTAKNHPLKGTYFISLGLRLSLNEGSYFRFLE